MASKTKALAPRAANKKARAARREEIVRRWTARSYERDAIQYMREACNDLGGDYANYVQRILTLGQWANHRDLVACVDHDKSTLLDLVAYLFRVIELKEMPYDDYLQTPEWKARARRAKERWDFECALDERHEADHAHHRTYVRRGRELAADIVPLCADCHAKFHGRER